MAPDRIDGLRIASPCSISWDAMEGDARVRHCTVCRLNVYNFGEMTREEVNALLARTEGRVCGRLYRRADGTVLTQDCPTGLRALRRRVSRAAAAVVAALLSLPGVAFGDATWKGSDVKLTTEKAATQQGAVFTGVVVVGDTPQAGVIVMLRDEAAGREVVTFTDAKGAFTFTSVAAGTYRVELRGTIMPATMEHLELRSNVVTHANIRAVAVQALMGVVLSVGVDQTPQHDVMSTTFPQSFIDKLPM